MTVARVHAPVVELYDKRLPPPINLLTIPHRADILDGTRCGSRQ